MKPFTSIEAIAAPLPLTNIDTDKILPGRFLKTVTRNGLGRALFADMRREPGFVLDMAPWDRSAILVAGPNFGCGSSREHAPWALTDFGIRCVIAPSFADIFHNNCFKNGILPVVLPPDVVEQLQRTVVDPDKAIVAVDLEAQTITASAGRWTFEIDAVRKADLLNGVDEIERTLADADPFLIYEQATAQRAPWNRPIDMAAYQADGLIRAVA